MNFIEFPKNSKFTFKEHLYEISFELVKDNHLKVHIHAKPSLENIHPEDYDEFKTYIKSIFTVKYSLLIDLDRDSIFSLLIMSQRNCNAFIGY